MLSPATGLMTARAGALRGPEAPGADGPANLLAAAIVAGSHAAVGLGALAAAAAQELTPAMRDLFQLCEAAAVDRWLVRTGAKEKEKIGFSEFFEHLRPVWRFVYYDVVEAYHGAREDMIKRAVTAHKDAVATELWADWAFVPSPDAVRSAIAEPPATAAMTASPSRTTPLKLPRETRQASTACLPMVSASLDMMQPPANTSAVRAST